MIKVERNDTMRLLARMLMDRDRHWSASSLSSSTMILRKMTEDGLVQMSLSKRGIPHYQITESGEQMVIADW